MHLQSRIVKWKGTGHVYYSINIYIANQRPCFHLKKQNGGISTFFSNIIVASCSRCFCQKLYSFTNNEGKNILVIKRQKGIRSYTEDDLLLKELDTVNKYVKVFRENGTLDNHIHLFNWTDVVIEPHGAGFCNWYFVNLKLLLLKQDGDGMSTMEMDNMYFRVAATLDLNYRLIIGKWSYAGGECMS